MPYSLLQRRFTAYGRKSAINLISDAEYISRNTGEKVRDAREIYASQGYKNGGRYPPGFCPSSTPRIPEHDPVYAELLNEIFERVSSGTSLLEIEKDLSKRGVRTPEFEIRKRGGEKVLSGGRPIRVDQLESWIRNPMYKGYVCETHHKAGQEDTHTFVKGLFEPIVSEELWAAANKALDDAKKSDVVRIQERDRWFHPLKGLIRCGVCGSLMSPRPTSKRDSNGRPYSYYRCRGAAEDRKACSTPVKQLPARLIEDLIYNYLGKMADSPEVIDALVGNAQRGKTSKIRRLGTEIRKHSRALDAIKKKIENLAEVAAEMGIKEFSEDLKKQVKRLTSKREEILAAIHRCQCEQDALKDERDYRQSIQNGLKHFSEALRTLSEKEQRELIQLIIQGIIIQPDLSNVRGGGGSGHQHMKIELNLKMGSLVRADSQRGRKLKVKLDVTLNRGKTVWASTTGDIPLDIGKPTSSSSPKKPSNGKRHEIHRADKIQAIMKKHGWSAADYARKQGISRSAVSQVMQWYQLSSECQQYLRELSDPKLERGWPNTCEKSN
ncbi:MAG: recombinase zinc beta ribbon domain-containing protein [Puniceicoccales bacterium]